MAIITFKLVGMGSAVGEAAHAHLLHFYEDVAQDQADRRLLKIDVEFSFDNFADNLDAIEQHARVVEKEVVEVLAKNR